MRLFCVSCLFTLLIYSQVGDIFYAGNAERSAENEVDIFRLIHCRCEKRSARWLDDENTMMLIAPFPIGNADDLDCMYTFRVAYRQLTFAVFIQQIRMLCAYLFA